MRNIIINGISGLIGTYLAEFFHNKGYAVIGISRNAKNTLKELPFLIKSININELNSLDAVIGDDSIIINLAGASIGAKRWSNEYKKEIIDSRVNSTKLLVDYINNSNHRIKLVNASAVGFYGDGGEQLLDESSKSGKGFLADVCKLWEEQANKIYSKDRLVIMRLGVVHSKNGGALEKILKPFKMNAGGNIGSGKQYFPWIHIEDIAELLNFIIQNNLCGVFNFTSSEVIRYNQLVKAIAQILNKPSFANVPAFALKIMLGEAAEMLLQSQRVVPKAALEAGYVFKFPSIEAAMKDVLGKE